jgi:hypothetical protein
MSNATELLKRALEALELMYFCHADQKWISYEQQKEKIHQQAIAEIEEIRAFLGENNIPLYTRPEPTRNPLSSDERLKGFIELRDNDDGAHLLSFLAGICFAEKHHGIIPRCENS